MEMGSGRWRLGRSWQGQVLGEGRCFSFLIFSFLPFFFFGYAQGMEVPGPGTEPAPQQ